MTTLHCDHHINLPYDAVTVLMVITCVLIYVISYFIHTYKLLQPMQYIYALHNICLYLLRCTVYTCIGMACAVNLLYIKAHGQGGSTLRRPLGKRT